MPGPCPPYMPLASCLGWLLLLTQAVSAAPPEVLQHVSLPGAARPLAIAASPATETILVGTSRRGGFDELYVLSTGAGGATLAIAWSLDLDTHMNAIAVDGSRAYLASSADRSELIVVDTELRAVVGVFDADGPANAVSVEVVTPGVVELGRRRGSGPEILRLDVRDPARIMVLEALEDPRGVRPPKPARLARYSHRGRLAARVDRPSDRGTLHYLAVTDRNAEIQVVEQRVPVVFPDVDGDGVYRLGCLGDSNTVSLPGYPGWCEQLRDRIDDPDFQLVNVSVARATVVAPNLHFDSDAAQQMAAVLAAGPDAVVLAFGTNDVFHGHTSAQLQAAYLARQADALGAGLAFFVATIPPLNLCAGPSCPLVLAFNDLLRASFPGRIVEFFDGFTAPHFAADGYHVSAAGQALRAERAFAVLANPSVYDVD